MLWEQFTHGLRFECRSALTGLRARAMMVAPGNMSVEHNPDPGRSPPQRQAGPGQDRD